jgi:hypothetical protein
MRVLTLYKTETERPGGGRDEPFPDTRGGRTMPDDGTTGRRPVQERAFLDLITEVENRTRGSLIAWDSGGTGKRRL